MLALIKISKTCAIIDKSALNVWKSSLEELLVAAGSWLLCRLQLDKFTIANSKEVLIFIAPEKRPLLF